MSANNIIPYGTFLETKDEEVLYKRLRRLYKRNTGSLEYYFEEGCEKIFYGNCGFARNRQKNAVVIDYSVFCDLFFQFAYLVWDNQTGRLFQYNNQVGIYTPITDVQLTRLLKRFFDLFDTQLYSPGAINAIANGVKTTARSVLQMNPKMSKIVLRNGVIDLNTMELEKHSRKHFSTHLIDIEYDENAVAPRYEQFLDEISCGNPKLRSTLNEMVGYVLSDTIDAKKLFLLVGNGKNGKSVFMKVLEMMVGEEEHTSLPISSLTKSTFARHDLAGKKLNILNELPDNTTISGLFNETVKAIVTGDTLHAEIKGGKNYAFVPTAKMVIATNAFPEMDRTPKENILRRFLAIEMKFVPEKEDIELVKQLRAERSGILNSALRGLCDLRERGFQFEYEEESREFINSEVYKRFPMHGFVKEKVIPMPGNFVRYDEIRQEFDQWVSGKVSQGVLEGSVANMSKTPSFSNDFKRGLDANGIPYGKKKNNGSRGISGITF